MPISRDDRLCGPAPDGARPGLAGAGYSKKSFDRLVHRNGYRHRAWEMRAGTVELRIPKVREGSFPGFVVPQRMTEKAFTAGAGGPVQGASTRVVDDLV